MHLFRRDFQPLPQVLSLLHRDFQLLPQLFLFKVKMPGLVRAYLKALACLSLFWRNEIERRRRA